MPLVDFWRDDTGADPNPTSALWTAAFRLSNGLAAVECLNVHFANDESGRPNHPVADTTTSADYEEPAREQRQLPSHSQFVCGLVKSPHPPRQSLL